MLFFWKKRHAFSRQIMGMNRRNIALIYPHNKRRDYTLADDKITTKTILDQHHINCADTYAIIEFIGTIEQAWQDMQAYQKIAIKPANGSGGGGIMILKKNKEGQWCKGGKPVAEGQIFKHLADIIMGVYSFGSKDRVLIEYCIDPHPFFHEIYPVGVPDIRIILLKQQPVQAMLRLPTHRSGGKANLHQGGLGIGVHLQTGLLKQAFDGKRYHDTHPDTGCMIRGKQIPQWEETVQLAIQTAKAFPLQYLGIDIVLDQELGPMIMEINVRPGLGIQLANQEGLQAVVQKLNATQPTTKI